MGLLRSEYSDQGYVPSFFQQGMALTPEAVRLRQKPRCLPLFSVFATELGAAKMSGFNFCSSTN